MASIRSALGHAGQVTVISALFVVYVAALTVKTVTNVLRRQFTDVSAGTESVQAPPKP